MRSYRSAEEQYQEWKEPDGCDNLLLEYFIADAHLVGRS